MVAVLGLWPESEEPPLPVYPAPGGGAPDGPVSSQDRRQERVEREQEPDRREQDRILRNRRVMVMTAIAYAEHL